MNTLLRYTSGADTVIMGLEALQFAKSNKRFPTYALIQKIWNKARQLQEVEGFTRHSPIWKNQYYGELARLTCEERWRRFGVTHLVHIFSGGRLLPFTELQERFGLPQAMYFYYLQLSHAVRTQAGGNPWILSSAPIFQYMTGVTSFRGFISSSYSMLLSSFLPGFPAKVLSSWERDVGTFEEDQWEGALQAVQGCSLNTAQRLSQLFILMRVHYTPARLFRMGLGEDDICPRCARDRGDLIHLMWRCPKLHLYWSGVLDTLTTVFSATISRDPKVCVLGVLDDIQLEDNPRQAIGRALFQARKLILHHWKASEPPKISEWITQMGAMLRMEKYIYQHRGRRGKFDLLWAPWLDTPGLAPLELVLERILV